jgi:hypothetical protein
VKVCEKVELEVRKVLWRKDRDATSAMLLSSPAIDIVRRGDAL